MLHDTQNCWIFGLFLSSGILNKLERAKFRRLDLFPSSGEGGDTYSVGFLRES
jgi:hypothetical protein